VQRWVQANLLPKLCDDTLSARPGNGMSTLNANGACCSMPSGMPGALPIRRALADLRNWLRNRIDAVILRR